VVRLGDVDDVLTISEATDLHRALGEALLIAAKRHGQIDPRIVEDPEDERRCETYVDRFGHRHTIHAHFGDGRSCTPVRVPAPPPRPETDRVMHLHGENECRHPASGSWAVVEQGALVPIEVCLYCGEVVR
jgi:hypothetical protein